MSASNPGPVTISAPRRPGLRPTAASWDSQRAPARFQQLLFTVAGYLFGNIPVVQDNFSLVVIAIILLSMVPMIVEVLKARRESKQKQATKAAGAP